MKLDYIYNVIILMMIILFYMTLVYRYNNDSISLNDLSIISTDCYKYCNNWKLNIMLCLDSCAMNSYNNTNDSQVIPTHNIPLVLLILTLTLFLFYIYYKEVLHNIFSRIMPDKKLANIYSEDEELELNQYHKITDI